MKRYNQPRVQTTAQRFLISGLTFSLAAAMSRLASIYQQWSDTHIAGVSHFMRYDLCRPQSSDLENLSSTRRGKCSSARNDSCPGSCRVLLFKILARNAACLSTRVLLKTIAITRM